MQSSREIMGMSFLLKNILIKNRLGRFDQDQRWRVAADFSGAQAAAMTFRWCRRQAVIAFHPLI
jgi:hypothetical protein